jgi:hypothetical protein
MCRKEKTIWLNIIHIKVNLQNDAVMCEQMNRFSSSSQDNKLNERAEQDKTKQRKRQKKKKRMTLPFLMISSPGGHHRAQKWGKIN